jgi:hypothetical protein
MYYEVNFKNKKDQNKFWGRILTFFGGVCFIGSLMSNDEILILIILSAIVLIIGVVKLILGYSK